MDSEVGGTAGTAETRAPEPTTPTDLDARYGRTRRSSRRTTTIAWVGGVAVALTFGAWVVWAGLDGSGPELDVRDTGYALADDSATARFQVTVDPGTEVRCAVQALNEQFEIVGWRVVDLPAAEERTTAHSESVRTTMPSTTALINRCWLP